MRMRLLLVCMALVVLCGCSSAPSQKQEEVTDPETEDEHHPSEKKLAPRPKVPSAISESRHSKPNASSTSSPSATPAAWPVSEDEEVDLHGEPGSDPKPDTRTEPVASDDEDPYLNDSGDARHTVASCDPTLGCEQDASLMITLSLTLMIGAIFMLYMFARLKMKNFPESTATILLGIAVGLLIRLNGKTLSQILYFNPETFFLYLLPPIIFESGYSLNRVNFFKNLVPVTVFAVLGTIISTVVIGIGIFVAGFVGLCYQLDFMDCLLWGSLISAIDPVATLAIFNSLDVPPQMYMLVFGESVLNDAVAVVLFRTFVDLGTSEFTSWTVLMAFLSFLQSLVGSVVLGCVVGLFSALVFKHTLLREHHSLEMSLVFIFAYFPYLLAEGCNLSGITAILFCGIVMAHYTHNNLSMKSQAATKSGFSTLAFLADTFVFAYLGLAVFAFAHKWHIALIAVSLVLCVLGRACNIFPLARLLNRTGLASIDDKTQFIMFFSGLRGAVAFALALNAPSKNSNLMVTTTLAVVLFSIFVFGGGTGPLLGYFKVGQDQAGGSYSQVETEPEAEESEGQISPMSRFEQFDNEYMRPWFCVDPHIKSEGEDLEGTPLTVGVNPIHDAPAEIPAPNASSFEENTDALGSSMMKAEAPSSGIRGLSMIQTDGLEEEANPTVFFEGCEPSVPSPTTSERHT